MTYPSVFRVLIDEIQLSEMVVVWLLQWIHPQIRLLVFDIPIWHSKTERIGR
jgi:hypothetical protein